jgi:hypothetical protein
MGRTVMPFSYLLDKEHGKWKEFRKCLSKENQEAFDRLFDRAKFHTAAGVYMSHPYPLETILISICLEHEKLIGVLQKKLNERDAQQKPESEQPLRLL